MTGTTPASMRSGMFSPHPLSVEVGVGEIAFAEAPARLFTPALGSCVSVAIWDPLLHTGVLAHVMLPSPGEGCVNDDAKYASFAVPAMVQQLVNHGSLKRRLEAKIAGGAAMFSRDTSVASIGERNAEEVKRQLELMQVPLLAEDTGQGHARTVELVLETGVLLVHCHRYGTREI